MDYHKTVASEREKISMNLASRFCRLCLVLLALTGCINAGRSAGGLTPTGSSPDSDALTLITMSGQAAQLAKNESQEVALRQIDTDLNVTDFRFVDRGLTKEIMVVIPEPSAPIDKWTTEVNSVSPLLGNAEPAINLQSLRVGPKRVAQAITSHWPGCVVRGMTLYTENDKLTWVAFCNTSEGVASGNMDNQTGKFQPSDAPPAPEPVTATPAP